MQTLTIRTYNKLKRFKSPFNIGDDAYIIDYTLSKPIIIEGYILAIGISNIFNADELIYFIDRSIKTREEFKPTYIKDIFRTRKEAMLNLCDQLEKYTKGLRDKAILIKESE